MMKPHYLLSNDGVAMLWSWNFFKDKCSSKLSSKQPIIWNLIQRFHDHWLPLSDEDEEGVWRHYETGEVRSCSLSLSSSLSLTLSSSLYLSSSFLCNRPSENLKRHQRWQRSRTGVLDNQTGERSRTALASESSTATGWTLILSQISYFTIFSIVQY